VTDVDGDDDIGAHVADHVDRQVPHQKTVDQQLAVDLQRRESPRYRHGSPDRPQQIAAVDHHHLASLQIGGDGTERNGQVVETVVTGGIETGNIERESEFLASDQTGR